MFGVRVVVVAHLLLRLPGVHHPAGRYPHQLPLVHQEVQCAPVAYHRGGAAPLSPVAVPPVVHLLPRHVAPLHGPHLVPQGAPDSLVAQRRHELLPGAVHGVDVRGHGLTGGHPLQRRQLVCHQVRERRLLAEDQLEAGVAAVHRVTVLGRHGPGEGDDRVHARVVLHHLPVAPVHHRMVALIQPVHPGGVSGACLHLHPQRLARLPHRLVIKLASNI